MSVNYGQLAGRLIKSFGAQKNFNHITGVCRLVAAAKDEVKVEFDVDEHMTNSWKTLHGGCTASLVDMVTTIAILSHDTNKHPGVSVNLNVSYCSAAKMGETIIMDAIVEKRGKTMAFTRANLYRKIDGLPIATAQHIKAFPPPPKSTE